jgi:type VI secretion system protein ImpE
MTAPQAGTSARELLATEGPLAAIEQLKKDVRKAPRDARLRTFLFQLFCILGEWDRALTQLSVVSELDPLAPPMTQTYRAVIRCEMLRERVFAGERSPTLLGEPAHWMSLLVEATRVLATGAATQAASLRDAAFEAAPAVSGTLNGTAFEWIADADPRLGPMLEAMVEGKYYWVPFSRIARVDAEVPADLRDQVWMPVHFTWSGGGETPGFIPTRYPGSIAAGEDLAMSRRTEWREQDGWFLGLGQRVLATDTDEVALLDVRRLEIAAQAD